MVHYPLFIINTFKIHNKHIRPCYTLLRDLIKKLQIGAFDCSKILALFQTLQVQAMHLLQESKYRDLTTRHAPWKVKSPPIPGRGRLVSYYTMCTNFCWFTHTAQYIRSIKLDCQFLIQIFENLMRAGSYYSLVSKCTIYILNVIMK